MSNDPWGIFQDDSKAQIKYAQHISTTEDKGNWQKIYVDLIPIEPDKESKQHTFFSFLPDWRQICKPSVKEIVVAQPKEKQAEFAAKIAHEQTWIKFYWEEYRDYDKRAVAKKKSDGYEKYVDVDEKGREYLKYLGIHYLKFFFDEQEWQQDYEQNKNGVVETASPPQENNPATDAAKAAIPGLLEVYGTDIAKFQEVLKHPPLNTFTINSPEVKSAVGKMIADKCGPDATKLDAMLSEINSHFTEDYLTVDSQELLQHLDETPF